MASTEKLPSGRYRGLYRDSAGAKQRVPGTFGRKKDAKDAATVAEGKAKRQAAAARGTLPATITWSEWWEVFNADREYASDTAYTEASIVKNHISPKWGDVPLVEIRRADAKKWAAKLQREHSQNYARRIFAVWRTSINAAVEEEVLTASPLVGVTVSAPKRKPKRYLTTDETAAYAAHMHAWAKRAVELAAETGLRPGELAGLHAEQVNLSAGWIDVTQVYVHRRRFIRPSAENKTPRRIPLTQNAKRLIVESLGERAREGCGITHTTGKKCRSPLVFLTDSGEVVTRVRITNALKQAADRAGIGERSAYDLRRGYATYLAARGVAPTDIKRVMGHADLEQTDEYVQETPAAAARITAAFDGPQPLAAVRTASAEEGPGMGPDAAHGTGHGTDTVPDAAASCRIDRSQSGG